MKAVLYFGNNPFVLVDITKNAKGEITSGWVVNGEWMLEMDDQRIYVKKGNNIVDTYFKEPFLYIEVPEEMRCNSTTYNKVIDWANKELLKYRKAQDEQKSSSQEKINGVRHLV
jgi:hypothetical protein